MSKKSNSAIAYVDAQTLKMGRTSFGKGLFALRAGNSARWMYEYIWKPTGATVGEDRRVTLGNVATMYEHEAAAQVHAIKVMLSQDRDPQVVAREREQAAKVKPQFMPYAMAVMDKITKDLKTERNRKAWKASILRHCACIGKLRIDEIETRHVVEVLEKIWISHPTAGADVRSRMWRILAFATAENLRTGDNPAELNDALKVRLGKTTARGEIRGSFKAVPAAEIPGLLAQLASKDVQSARMLECQILCVTRPHMITNMERNELDLDKGVWTIPNHKMKMDHGMNFDVPLAPRVLQILRQQCLALDEVYGSENYFVWPGRNRTGAPVTHGAMLPFLRSLGVEETVHGFRTSFRTWLSPARQQLHGFDRTAVEMCLHHVDGGKENGEARRSKTERAYDRNTFFEERRPIMQAWWDHCLPPASKARAPLKLVA